MHAHGFASLLRHDGYRAVLATQFLGALNDNILRFVVCLYVLSPSVGAADPSTWIALGGAAFVAPYLLFAGHAGRLTDSMPKRRVLIGAKLAELAIMLAAMASFALQSPLAMTVALFLLATQSTYFSPARYAILPEMLAPADLGRANGLGEMSMFAAIVLGMGVGGYLFDMANGAPLGVGLPLMLIAAAGIATSLAIPARQDDRGVPGAANDMIRRDIKERGWRLLRCQPVLAVGVAGMSLFWCFGSLLQIDILFLGAETLGLDQTGIGLLQGTLGLGVGIGGVMAGHIVHRVALARLAQAGAVLLTTALFFLVFVPLAPITAFVGLFLAGCGGGAFIVPIIVVLQTRCDPASRGRLFAINNFLNMIAVLFGIGMFWTLHAQFGLSPEGIVRILAIAASVTLGLIAIAPARLARLIHDRAEAAVTESRGDTR